ncbi:MAG: DUF6174 domain-containing protein [Treponema sp.]|jgi:hypothetical protein|nr:DUF6174 domain-containing protein [Treponema sp.]
MKKYLFILFILPLFCACPELFWQSKFSGAEFNNNYKLWQDRNLQNYTFEQSVRGKNDGVIPAVLVVQNGELKYIRNTDKYKQFYNVLFLPDDYHCKFYTMTQHIPLRNSVPEIFKHIEKLHKSGTIFHEISYNDEYHYPERVYYGNSNLMIIRDFSLKVDVPEETRLTFDREAFDANRRKWNEGNYSNYWFWFEYGGSGYFTKEDKNWIGGIIVKDGKVDEIIPKDKWTYSPPWDGPRGDKLPDADALSWIMPIEGIFDRIEEEAGKYTGEGGLSVNILYADLGYPIHVYCLYISPDSPDKNVSYKFSINCPTKFDPE